MRRGQKQNEAFRFNLNLLNDLKLKLTAEKQETVLIASLMKDADSFLQIAQSLGHVLAVAAIGKLNRCKVDRTCPSLVNRITV